MKSYINTIKIKTCLQLCVILLYIDSTNKEARFKLRHLAQVWLIVRIATSFCYTQVLGFKHESKHNRSTVYLGVLDKLMEGSRSVICPCLWTISRSASSPPPCPRGWPAPAASATSSSRAPVCVFLMSCDPRCEVDIISSCISLNV